MGHVRIVITATILFSLLAASQAYTDSTWTGATGSWHDPLNWDNGIPTSSDFAYIDNDGTAQISADAEVSHLHVGFDNSGAVEQTGGTITTVDTSHQSDGLYLGYSSGSSGTYNLSAGELSTILECIGYDGTGEFNQTGGTHSVEELRLGTVHGSSGTYNLSAGELSVGSEIIAGIYYTNSVTGEFNQTGGTHTVSGNLSLGLYHFNSGIYNLGGTGELSVGSNEYIGYFYGTGEFNQTGGTHSVDG